MPEKYQQEIEEILKNAGEPAPDRSGRELEKPPDDEARPRQQFMTLPTSPTPTRSRARVRLPVVRPHVVLRSGLIMFVIAAWFSPGFFMWVGLALIGLGYLIDFRLPRSSRTDPRWRGRSVASDESTWDRIKRRKNG